MDNINLIRISLICTNDTGKVQACSVIPCFKFHVVQSGEFPYILSVNYISKVITNCDNLGAIKYSPSRPFAFTEQGVAMLSSVLNSERAVQMNIFIMRAFVKLRQMIANNKGLANKVEKLELEQNKQGLVLAEIYGVVKRFIDAPIPKKKKIGFSTADK